MVLTPLRLYGTRQRLGRDWIPTIPSWPATFQYMDMTEVGMRLSQILRDPQGEHRCDIIIALTHSRSAVGSSALLKLTRLVQIAKREYVNTLSRDSPLTSGI